MKPTDIPLPKEWPTIVKSAVLQVISLAHYVMTYTRSWCANNRISRLRSRAKLELVEQEIALLTEELRIKDARDKQDTWHDTGLATVLSSVWLSWRSRQPGT